MDSTTELARTLEQIGLSEKEARVYLALLSLESATAYRVAEHCDVKKPTVYIILDDLRKKGLVLKIPHTKKALFAAQDITDYLQEQEAALKSARAIAPKLRSLGTHPRGAVFFFEGLRGVSQAMDYKLEMMRGKTFYCFYGNLAGCSKEMIGLYKVWDHKAVDAGALFQIVMAKLEADQYYGQVVGLSKTTKSVQIHFLDNYTYPPNQSIYIGDRFVRIVNESELQATVIEDAQTANAMRQIFQIVWEKGR